MTDDATTPRSDNATTPRSDEPDAGAATEREDRSAGGADAATARRRRLIIGGVIAAAVLLILAGCLAAGALVRSGVRMAERSDDDDRRRARLGQACLELETRLNRLAPPGATGGDPRRRADAIRDENAALRPLLVELEGMSDGRGDGEGRRRAEWVRDWRRLVEARTAYAEALERQAAAGDPAFFIAPRGPGGEAVVDALDRRTPDECAGAMRRLGQPDL